VAFDGGYRIGTAQEATAQISQAEAAIRQAGGVVEEQVRTALAARARADGGIVAAEEELRLATARLDAARVALDAGVIPWIPADTHPLRQVAATRHRLHAGHEYRRQHAALVAWLAERGAPDVVAPYSLLKRGDSTVSFACWQDGPTLLPAVDFVVAGAPSQALSARWFPWSTLLDRGVLQDPEPDLAPVRYRVGRYPDDFRQGPVTMDPPGSLTGFPIS
jgi:hypothetical protein